MAMVGIKAGMSTGEGEPGDEVGAEAGEDR